MLPKFNDPKLLTTALTHRSALNENISESLLSNERLEFLGDAVLELITTQFLYDKFPEKPEGELTAIRSALVKTTTLAKAAKELGLGEKLMMSKGEEVGGGRDNESLLADTMEAVIGALYIDQGHQAVENFLLENLLFKVDNILENKLYQDPKSQLQEVVQALGLAAPEYQVTAEIGPDHNKEFNVRVMINDQEVADGNGRSKQTAQQEAARKALLRYQDQ